MLSKWYKSDPVPNPDDILTGTCATCKTVLTLPRWQCKPPNNKPVLGLWGGMTTAECQQCKAESEKATGVVGKSGTAVQMVKR